MEKQEIGMRTSIGMETRSTATEWSRVKRGPSLAAVRAHVARLSSYPPAWKR
jgi:hypothetical protein